VEKEGLWAMADLCQSTCDPHHTPSVSAAKALVVEEQLGVFNQQQAALLPLTLQGGKEAHRGGGVGGASMSSSSSSSPLNPTDWNHRFMVPDNLHFVASKRLPEEGKASSNSSAKHNAPHCPLVTPLQTSAARGEGNGSVEVEKPKTSWEGFSGTGGGGDGSGAGTGSAEPWDYGDLFSP